LYLILRGMKLSQAFLKWPKNSKFYSFSDFFPKVSVQIVHILACSTRLVNAYEKIITFDNLQT
jgi:hypothetical protein